MPVDITLVHPLFICKDPVEQKLMTPYFPLGLLYLAAVLRQDGYRVDIFDCTFRQDYREFETYLQQARPRVVGITSLITIRRHALILSEIAHRQGATVILGGPDPTGIPERYLHHRVGDEFAVDLVVHDEGELTLRELMAFLVGQGDHPPALAEIAGLRRRGPDGRITATAPRPRIDNLDALPFPARDLVDMQAYREAWRRAHGYWSLSMINTRGCPYDCAWCQRAVFGRLFRTRSAASSAAEMQFIKETYAPDHLRIVDDITGIRKQWVQQWRDEILARDAAIPFECLTRVNLATPEMLAALKEAGCQKIYFGAESGSQKVLDAMNKGIKVAQIDRAAELCRQFGIKTYFFMMVGYPGETWEDLQASVQLLRRTRPDEFSTTIAYPLPGTKFYEQVRDRLLFSGDWKLDWDYTAENRLLFRRDRYNSRFYRWVVRWFHKEWETARLQTGQPCSPVERARIWLGLWLARLMVRLLAHLPAASTVRFQPAEGR